MKSMYKAATWGGGENQFRWTEVPIFFLIQLIFVFFQLFQVCNIFG